MLGGEHENEALRQQISWCCRHLIVIFSDEFFRSPVNQFLITYAHWKGVKDTKRMIIPCLPKPCNIPEPWDSYRVLYYYKQTPLYNFWDKLLQSVSKESEILMSKTNDTIIQCSNINDKTLESAKSSALVKSIPKILDEVPPKQETEAVSLTMKSSIDQLLSKLPEIVSDEPCSITKTKITAKKKAKWFTKFRKCSKERTPAMDT